MPANALQIHWPFPARRVALFAGAGFALAVAVVALVPFRAHDLFSRQSWSATGSFTKGGAWPFTKFDRQISGRDKAQLDFWGSWSSSQSFVGTLRSPVFQAPPILECFLAGYPGKPGLDLFLERQSDHLRIPLPTPGNSYPGEVWRRFYWPLPPAARGQLVTLVALDQARDQTGWFGVSTPRRFSYLAMLHQELPSNLFMLGHFLLNFSLFLLPGFALACALSTRRPAALRYPLITIISTSAFLGYVCFYAFLFSKPGGKFLVLVIYLASLAFIGFALRARTAVKELITAIAEPVTVTALAALCYLSFTFLFINPAASGAGTLDGRFFTRQMPGDNLIPLFFAQKIYDHKPLRPFCCGDWLSSDRPPLQTGIFLMERPLPLTSNVDLNYELLAAGLQCLWICGVWCVLQSLGTNMRQIRRALALLIFSGLIFYDSVYTWPKFLTGALVLFAVSILIQVIRTRRPASFADAFIAAVCLGEALVSHPGSIFSLAVIPFFLLRFRALFPVRKLAVMLPVLAAFLLPWSAYQKLVDPPGTRLIKWHLAGVIPLDASTPLQAIAKAYSARPWSEIVHFRLLNMHALAGSKPFELFGFGDPSRGALSVFEWSRVLQEQFLWDALGVLNVGWFAALFFLTRKRAQPAVPYAGWLILAVLVNLVAWCVLEFGPYYTIIATLSFADFLMLSLGLIGFILKLPEILFLLLLAVQLFNFFAIWVWSPPYAFNAWAGTEYTVSLQLPLLIFGSLFALILLAHLLCHNETSAS